MIFLHFTVSDVDQNLLLLTYQPEGNFTMTLKWLIMRKGMIIKNIKNNIYLLLFDMQVFCYGSCLSINNSTSGASLLIEGLGLRA